MLSVEYFQTIIDCMGDPAFVKDENYKCVFVTNTLCEMFDRPYEEWLGKTDYDFFPKEQADVFRMHDRRVLETGEKDLNEEEVVDAHDNVRIIETKKTLYVSKTGERYIIGAVRDITERKRSEEALRTSQLHLSEAMELAEIVYWEVDPADDVFVFNDSFYAFYHTTAEQEGGYRMSREEYTKRFMHPDDQLRISHLALDIADPGLEFHPDLEHRIVCRNGEVRDILVRRKVIRDDSGRIIKRYGANQDITDRKNAERELRTKSLHLEEVNTTLRVLLEQREKDKNELEDKILFNVKNLVLPYVDSLKQRHLDEDQRIYLDMLETNLKSIVSPFAKKMTFIYENFTPLEIRVADFIRDGKTVKEIARTFGVSESAVNLHRQHIRNKLGLNRQKINLRTHLMSLQ
jgi:PAS domain S-box-containing protein